jgi:hypothetical protein
VPADPREPVLWLTTNRMQLPSGSVGVTRPRCFPLFHRTVRSALLSIVRFGSGGLIITTLAIYVGFTLLGWLVAAFYWALRLRRPF